MLLYGFRFGRGSRLVGLGSGRARVSTGGDHRHDSWEVELDCDIFNKGVE